MQLFFKYFPYKEINHTTLLLYGFHLSFFVVFVFSLVPDYYFESYLSFYIDFLSATTVAISYYLLHFKKRIFIAKVIILLLTIIPLFVLLFVNHSSHFETIYIVLLPLVSFYLFRLKEAMIASGIIYLLLISMLYYIYLTDTGDMIVHNNFAIINLFLATFMVFIFGIFYHLGIESSFLKLRKSNVQKDILLKEVHHRVKNNLNVISSILGLQAMMEDEKVASHLSKSKLRIEAIAIVHEMLYKQDDFEKIVFNEYVKKLSDSILSMYKLSKKIEISIQENDSLVLSLDVMTKLGIIINEMLTNSMKHIKKDTIKIDISLSMQGDTYVLNYKDDGDEEVNMDALKSSNGLGLKLIELSVKQLDSQLDVNYDKGLEFEMRFQHA